MVDTKSWRDKELHGKASELLARGVLDRTIAEMGLSVLDSQAAFDAGFEYGVLATENGLGRAEGA